jgi:hypothetical protein
MGTDVLPRSLQNYPGDGMGTGNDRSPFSVAVECWGTAVGG